ncbi:hypothetical protein NIES2104_29120 [Leptolyngbya sp. NIES-2104]|nr:hypothetical protein NIES2104_29120 [Leptolyngbya sp. NIES-2104]
MMRSHPDKNPTLRPNPYDTRLSEWKVARMERFDRIVSLKVL